MISQTVTIYSISTYHGRGLYQASVTADVLTVHNRSEKADERDIPGHDHQYAARRSNRNGRGSRPAMFELSRFSISRAIAPTALTNLGRRKPTVGTASGVATALTSSPPDRAIAHPVRKRDQLRFHEYKILFHPEFCAFSGSCAIFKKKASILNTVRPAEKSQKEALRHHRRS